MGQEYPFRYELGRNGCEYVINNAIIRKLKRFIERIKTEFINSRNMEEFINIVKGRVDVIIDVRYNIFFKREQGFGPEEFKKTLKSQNLEYFYIQDLGNPYHKEYKDDPVKAKQVYLNYLKKELIVKNSKDFYPRKSLQQLFNKIEHKKNYKQKVFCLLCYCGTINPERCHRFWLKEALVDLKRIELGLPSISSLNNNNNKNED